MDAKKDYYAVLGVLPSAEFETIQAVYRALSKKYHPDVSRQNRTESEEKIREINEAYETLSDVSKRKNYDKEREQTGSQHSNFYEEDVDEKTASGYSDPKMDEDWKRVSEYYPEIERYRKNLELLSQDLAFTYKAYVISEKVFESSKDFHLILEKTFLKRFFGSHEEIQEFGKKLLLDKKKKLAQELNKDIVFFGSDINPREFIIKFTQNKVVKKEPPKTSSKKYWSSGKNESWEEYRSSTKKEPLKTTPDSYGSDVGKYYFFATILSLLFLVIFLLN